MKQTLSVQETKNAICKMSDAIIDNETYLTMLDKKIGDGDHGINMKLGFTNVRNTIANKEFSSINQILYETGMALIRNMGGASGVIFGTMFIGGMRDMPETMVLDADFLGKYLEYSLMTIQRRGKSKPGQKTMLDALAPAVEALRENKDKTIEEALKQAADAAYKGMEDTKNMIPQAGRSRQYAQKAIGYADSGAMSVAILFRAFYDSVRMA